MLERIIPGAIALSLTFTVALPSGLAEETTRGRKWRVQQTIHPQAEPLTFVFEGYEEDDRDHIRGLTIFSRQDGRLRLQQRIADIEAWSYDLLDGGYVLEDLNFDGYADLRIQEFLPASPNVPYLYWLYNPENQQFEAAPSLAVITRPEVDAEQQIIKGFARVNALSYVLSDYGWHDGELVLLREERVTYEPDDYRRVVILERQGDRLVVVSDRRERVELE